MRNSALIFDFGNVVGFFDYLKVCQRLGPKLGLTGEAFRRQILDRGFTSLLARFESGSVGPQDFAHELTALSGLKLAYDEFVDAWQDMFWLNEPVANLIENLKGNGYPLLLGSNTNILHSTYYRRRFAATMDLFDHFVLSHEVGHLKPAAPFYEACVSKAGLAPSACIFIDDLLENVEGARRVGLAGVHYVDTPTLVADLTHLGVEIAPGL